MSEQESRYTNREEESRYTNREGSFDELARGLATDTISRGRALRMLGAALVGGAFASIPGAAWAACRPLLHKCTGNFQCCSRNCIKNPQGNGRICGCPTGKTLCGGRCVTNCTAPKVPNPTNNCACECPANLCTAPKIPDPTNNCACKCPTGSTICGNTCCPSGETCQANAFAPAPRCCPVTCAHVVTTPGGESVCMRDLDAFSCTFNPRCTTNADCASGQYCIQTYCDIGSTPTPGGRCVNACGT
jgi:hypothetical protein